MQLCQRCQSKEATVHFTHKVDGRATVKAHLCEECARPLLSRQEAFCQGPHPCLFCGRDAFSPLEGVRKITHACCGCRRRYSQVFFELCADERPDLLLRSEREMSFFEMCFNPDIEEWANRAGNKAIQILKNSEPQDACDPKS